MMRSSSLLAFSASSLLIVAGDASGVAMTKLSPIGVDDSLRDFGRSVLIHEGETYIGSVRGFDAGPTLDVPPTGVVW